jgi:hypothetical protein
VDAGRLVTLILDFHDQAVVKVPESSRPSLLAQQGKDP